ncbi:MAG TPA: hypothetical protein VGM96_05020 [Reyranella sp.]|jgi:hypothetical protein
MTATPYVSFVSYGRNDAYTPSYVRRVNRAMVCLARQLEGAGVDGEIVIADWNPPAGRPRLIDILDVPSRLRHVSIRGIVVEPEHHLAFAGAAERAIHAGEAANVGIRRARGRFVTPKASDTFFSPQAIAMLARRDLDEGTMYRMDRHDIVAEDEAVWQLDDDALLAKLQCMPSLPNAWICQSEHWGLRNLHTNACGDFTLMALRHWHRLRGHPHDDTVLTLDIDSLIMHAAAALGVRECRWPDDCRIYKPSHENLSNARISQIWTGWQRTLDNLLSARVSEQAALRARILFDYPRRKVRGVESVVGPSIERNFVASASRWAQGGKPPPWQPENWGLADATLEERVICRADWETVMPAGRLFPPPDRELSLDRHE